MSNDEGGIIDRFGSMGGLTTHHIICNSRVREANRNDGKSGLIPNNHIRLPNNIHQAYHILFQNAISWEVQKRLKAWIRSLNNGSSRTAFYLNLSVIQYEAFQFLFGFIPEDLGQRGSLGKALAIVGDTSMFYPKKETLAAAIIYWQQGAGK